MTADGASRTPILWKIMCRRLSIASAVRSRNDSMSFISAGLPTNVSCARISWSSRLRSSQISPAGTNLASACDRDNPVLSHGSRVTRSMAGNHDSRPCISSSVVKRTVSRPASSLSCGSFVNNRAGSDPMSLSRPKFVWCMMRQGTTHKRPSCAGLISSWRYASASDGSRRTTSPAVLPPASSTRGQTDRSGSTR